MMIKYLIIIFSLFLSNLNAQKALDYIKENYNLSNDINKEISFTKEITSLPIYAFSDQTDISSYVKASIDSSKLKLDIALYGISNMDLAKSLVEANKRGVKLRIIINQSHLFNNKVDPSLQYLLDNKLEVKTLRGAGRYGIMHNKIAIFDDRILLTGSYNWTLKANNNNFENAIFTSDIKIIKGYSEYFNWMWNYAKDAYSGPMSEYDYTDLNSIPIDNDLSISFNNAKFPSYSFSPNGGIKDIIVKAIKNSKKSINIAMFSFYEEEIYKALIEAKNKGLKITIFVDRVQASQSDIIKNIYNDGFALKWISGYNGLGVMHNKFSIYDEKLLISGSFNFSQTANNYNYENVFITDKQNYVKDFVKEFNSIYEKAKNPTKEEIDSINKVSNSSSFSQ